MENIDISHLNRIFSQARLSPYQAEGDSAKKVLENYHKNIVLSEAMVPTLHYLEICFRNRINHVISQHYGAQWLIEFPEELNISPQDKEKINKIASKIRRENTREALHDDIVAQMTFGFWCAFFHRKYDTLIWHRKDALKSIFPSLERSNRTRSYIEERILKIKEVRNRIAHHEPVWNHKVSVVQVHALCHELIHSMSSEAAEWLKTIDRFPEVYRKHSL